VGAVLARALFEDNGYVVSFGSLFVAIALVVVYRRYVQHRPVWGPEALRFPERGLGVDQYRERLRKVGIDPDARVPAPADMERARLRGMVDDLHRAGILDDEEHEAKLRAIDDRAAQ
jgi:hypothetical protein